MTLLTFAVAAVLAQAAEPTPTPSPTPAAEPSPADKAALAAERAALAAERTAQAVERLAGVLAPAAEEKKPGPPKPDLWSGSAGLGVTFITGNMQVLTLTANLTAERIWGDWSLGLRAGGAYGLTNATANVADTAAQTTARRANGTVRGARSFGLASIYALGGAEFDHVKNVESREFGEAGTGLTFFDVKEPGPAKAEKLYLRLDLAMRAGYETRFRYFPTAARVDPYGIVILAPRVAATFRWNLNQHVRISEELEIIPFLLAPTTGRLLINDTTKLSANITPSIALTTALVINYDSMPPPSTPAKLSTDVALTVGVEAAF